VGTSLSSFLDQVSSKLGGRYGGAWGELDGKTAVMVVAVVGAQSSDEKFLEDTANEIGGMSSVPVSMRDAAVSFDSLSDMEHKLAAVVGEDKTLSSAVGMITVRPDTSRALRQQSQTFQRRSHPAA
jgi:hypothetical protein